MQITKKITIHFPTYIAHIKNIKLYKNSDEINITAIDDENISFAVNNKNYSCTVDADSSAENVYPYMAFGSGWNSDPDAQGDSVEWTLHLDTMVTYGRDITKITFESDYELDDITLLKQVYDDDLPEEIGVFTRGSDGVYSIGLLPDKFIIAQKGTESFYRPLGLKPRPAFPKIECIPYMVHRNRVMSTTVSNGTYTADVDGYVIMFSEGGTASDTGNGRSTTTFTAPRDPAFQYDWEAQGTTNWWYSCHMRVYYIHAGETVTINAQNKSGNARTYLYTVIYRMPYMEEKYSMKMAYKGWNANTYEYSWTHQPNPKDRYAVWFQMASGGNTSAANPTLSSDDNNRLILPEITYNFSFSSGGTAYVSARMFKLPEDIPFTIKGKGNTSSSTRTPCNVIVFTEKF